MIFRQTGRGSGSSRPGRHSLWQRVDVKEEIRQNHMDDREESGVDCGTKRNSQAWEKVYQTTDFGNTYPTDGLVSLYYHFIRRQLNTDSHLIKVLDFGCSHGANAKFFASLGFDVYGIDISREAVDYCIRQQGFDSSRFTVCNLLEKNSSICEMFGKFDLVIASECLYYFSDTDRRSMIQQFYDCMKEQAVIYANMHTWNHQLYRNYQNAEVTEEGLVQIPASGLADLPLGVRIVADKQEMREMFGAFEEIAVVRSLLEMESENETLHFIGKKGKQP